MSAWLMQSFAWVLRSSWQAAVLVGVVLLVQWLLRRPLSPRWRFQLWLVVIVRLLLPISAESSWSVFNLVKMQPESFAPPEPRAVVEMAPAPMVMEPAKVSPPVIEPAEPSSAPVVVEELRPVVAVPTPKAPISWWSVAAWIWAGGVMLFASRIAWLTMRMTARQRRAQPVEDESLIALLAECGARIGVRRCPQLRSAAWITSPALFGFWRPSLLLPRDFQAQFSASEIRYIFLHELAHVKRRDVLLNWLLTALQVVHWFNPVIWLAWARLRTDRELACDAMAIAAAGGGESRAYGQTILKVLENLSRPAAVPGLVGILEDRTQMRRRILTIARFRQPGRWQMLALILLGALAVTGLTDAVRPRAALAKTNETPAKPEAENGEMMTVTVVDEETRQPLAGARVLLTSQALHAKDAPTEFKTDEHGSVAVPKTAARDRGLTALYPGRAPMGARWVWLYGGQQPEPPASFTLPVQRGKTIGGVVRDEKGTPLAGVRVELTATTNTQMTRRDTKVENYSYYQVELAAAPVTDAAGRWLCRDFPSDTPDIGISLVRADHACRQFRGSRPGVASYGGGEQKERMELYEQKAEFVFKPGVNVRGVVTDEAGQPLSGMRVEELDGRILSKPLADLRTGPEGSFALADRDPHQILLRVTGGGRAERQVYVEIAPGLPEQKIVTRPAVPLRLRVVDEEGKPIVGAVLQGSFQWRAESDAAGRIVRADAPRERLLYSLEAPGVGSTQRELEPSETEQTLTLRRGEVPMLTLHLRATTAEGGPISAFTVTRFNDRTKEKAPLGKGAGGEFTTAVTQEDFSNAACRLMVEAEGFETAYTDRVPWRADFSGAVKMLKAGPARGRILQPDGEPAVRAKIIMPRADASEPMIMLANHNSGDGTFGSGWGRGPDVADGERGRIHGGIRARHRAGSGVPSQRLSGNDAGRNASALGIPAGAVGPARGDAAGEWAPGNPRAAPAESGTAGGFSHASHDGV